MDGEIRTNMCNGIGIIMTSSKNNCNSEYQGYVLRIISTIQDVLKNEVASGTDKSEAHYLSICLNLFKRIYEMDKKWKRFHVWSQESLKEVILIWNIIQPELAEFIQNHLKDLRTKKMTKEIKSSSAKAVIDAAMRDTGLNYLYTGQTHRAKVSVLIAKDRCLTVYIAYSKLNEQLPRIINSIKVIKDELDALGNNITINKVKGAWTL